MNKIYKVIWNEARNAYVVVSEIAKNHGSKSCSTKKLLAMLIATGVMTCASFDVLAAEHAAEKTAAQQYVALKAADFPANGPSRYNKNTWGGLGSYRDAEAEWNYQSSGSKKIGDYTYTYDRTNKYWVRGGYVLTVDENGGKYTPLSANKIHADVAYTGTGVPEGILQSVTSIVSANGTVTNMGESLNKVTAGSFAGVSHSGGTEVAGSWNYIIHDPSWEGFVDAENYKDGYVDLIGNKMPKGFITADSQKGLVWDNNKQAYIYKGKAVDYSNVYVIDGHIGVFTDERGDEVYTGTVYGKNNEILMTVKDKDNKFYSYWAAEVTDPSATMATYRVEEYNKNLAKLVENDDALYRNDIKEVTLTKDTNSATIGLMRNGDKAVDGAITVTSGGGTGGSDAGNDTFVKISNGKTEQTFATGSKVEAIGSKDATTGIKINGENYTIKSGSVVSVAQNAAKKTTTLTVDGKATTITDTDTHNALDSAKLDGKKLTITGQDKDSVEVDLSSIDTDTKYTEGKGIAIDENNGNAISVKLKEDENNLEVTEAGLALKKDLTVDSVKAGKFYMSNAGIGYGDKVYITSSGLNANSQKITGVAEGTISKDSTDAVNGSQLHAVKETANKGWKLSTGKGEAVNVAPGETVDFSGDKNIKVSNTGKAVKVELNKELTGLTSVITKNAYVTNVDASKNESVTNVGYVNNQIAGVTLTEGKGISITDKKINVKLKDGEENLKVDETGLYLRKDLTGMESITGVGDGKISFATGGNVTINNITFNKDGRIQGIEAGKDDNDAVNVRQLNEKVAAGDTDVHIQAGNYTVDKNNKVSMNLVDKAGNDRGTVTITGVAKAEDVAVVYDANGSLKSTNATSVGSSAIALGKEATAVANSIAIGDSSIAGYKGTVLGTNAESNREGATLVGYNTNSFGLYSTVVGTNATINTNGKTVYTKIVQGAAATVVGAMNKIDNTNGEGYSGVANNVMGAANTIEGSNGVTIQGSGNTVTDAYKDMDITYADGWAILGGDYSVLAKKESGAIAVVGGANTVSKQTDSTVIGYDNKLTGDKEKGSHDVFMAGSHNELNNVSDSIVMGNENAITGVSNVISFGHQNKIKANNAVAIGNGAGVSVEGGVALGVGSVANRAAGEVVGYDPTTGKAYDIENGDAPDYVWKATKGAVSVGSGGETRQITNVAAGAQDTDAVNVAQLKKVATEAGKHTQVKAGTNVGIVPGETEDGTHVYTVNADGTTVSGDSNVVVTAGEKDANNVTNYGVKLNKDLKGIESISNGDAKLTLGGFTTELTNGKGAAITLFGDTTTINNKVTVYKDGRIAGVAAGINDKDAVNVGQLNAVGATANMGWNLATNGVANEATNVKPGDFVDFSGDKNISVSHDGTNVKVELNKDIDVNSVQTNALNSKYNLSVGTMAENGIMPFLVNGTGAFYAAHNKFSVDKDGKVTATAGEIGNVVLQNGVYTGHSALRDGELSVSDASGNYSQITTKGAKLGKVTVAADGKISGVAAGAVTANSTDAVNGSQLHAVATEAGKHSKVVNGSNINVEEFDNDGQKIYKVNLKKDIMLGDLTGNNVSISGTNGTIEATGAIATKDRVYADKGAKLADIDVTGNKISNGVSSIVLDGSNVKVNDKVTIDQNGKISGVAKGEVSKNSTDAINGSQLNQTNENVAALDKRVTQNEADIAQNKADIAQNKADIAQNKVDIAQNKADIAQNKAGIVQNKTDIKNLDTRVTNVEELAKKHTTVTAGDNIAVTESPNKDDGKEYKVALDKNINLDSVTTGQTVMNNDGLKVGKDVSVTATAVTAGKTSISDEGVKVGNKTYISDKGLNANDQKVTNVAVGELSATSKDAVNGSQLYETNQAIANNATNISSLSHSISNLDNRVNKVGAGAAALAALHPLDFDPDAKWDFAAGYGNYRGANAAAVGAYYRPNEDTMFSVGGTFGNGENMVNAGVSFKLGSGSSHVSTSRVAMAKEIKELRGELEAMKSAMLDANAGKKIDTSKLQLFPDVPQNHWAYEYVAQLAGNGMIEGYPDGNFAGDRPMTRYEFAAILYRAMTKGAVLSDKILSEFSHELEYFTVDTIAKDKAGNPTIQRVRTVKENKNK